MNITGLKKRRQKLVGIIKRLDDIKLDYLDYREKRKLFILKRTANYLMREIKLKRNEKLKRK